MKNAILLLSATLCLSLASCKTKSKTKSSSSTSTTSTTKDKGASATASVDGVTPTSEPTVFNGVTDKSCAVEVSFGSPGSGIDGAALDKVTGLLDGKKIKYTSKNFGREGERRLCLPLTELKENEKKDLIDQLKKIAKEGQYVSVSIR